MKVIFLQQQGVLIPLWVALLAGALPIIGGIILWYLNRYKFFSEVQGQDIKNQTDFLKHEDFENEVIAKAYAEIAKLRLENLKLGQEKHSLEKDVQIKALQVAEMHGEANLALRERDGVVDRVKKLENEVIFEKNQCQQQIMELGLKYQAEIRELKISHEADIRELKLSVEFLTELIKRNGIEIPPIELNEVEVVTENEHTGNNQ